MPGLFDPIEVRGTHLRNRIFTAPMCQYSVMRRDGVPTSWHLVHLGSRATGGAALVFAEMTDVLPEGRISPGCTGIWNGEQEAAWRRIVDFVHAATPAKIGLQIAHAGRKGAVHHPWEGEDVPLPAGECWQTMAPSAEPYRPHWRPAKAMTRAPLSERLKTGLRRYLSEARDNYVVPSKIRLAELLTRAEYTDAPRG